MLLKLLQLEREREREEREIDAYSVSVIQLLADLLSSHFDEFLNESNSFDELLFPTHFCHHPKLNLHENNIIKIIISLNSDYFFNDINYLVESFDD